MRFKDFIKETYTDDKDDNKVIKFPGPKPGPDKTVVLKDTNTVNSIRDRTHSISNEGKEDFFKTGDKKWASSPLSSSYGKEKPHQIEQLRDHLTHPSQLFRSHSDPEEVEHYTKQHNFAKDFVAKNKEGIVSHIQDKLSKLSAVMNDIKSSPQHSPALKKAMMMDPQREHYKWSGILSSFKE